jgi:glucosamine-6-phosphate deaminase
MEIIIQPTAEQATAIAARIIARLVREKPKAVLGLATGSTPQKLYSMLVEMELDWRKVVTFNLDEYVGLAPTDERSYHKFMWDNLFDHVNIPKKNVNIPFGTAKNIPESCNRYERKIRAAGGVDLQVLGVGIEGHIGFNESTSSLASRTRIKTLTEETRKANAMFFGSYDEVPHHVLTMGVGTIMESRQCLLLAFGEKKARAVAAMAEGPITSLVPASALQMHPNVIVCVDDAAASRLKKADYYRWTYENKPEWQRF